MSRSILVAGVPGNVGSEVVKVLKALLCSVAETVLHQAPCSVLLIPVRVLQGADKS